MTRSPPITAHLVRVLAVAAVVVGGVDRHHDLGLPVDLNRYLDTPPGYRHAIVTLPTISTMSISPCVGHSCPFPVPSIQMAGQDPRRLLPSGLAGSVDLTWAQCTLNRPYRLACQNFGKASRLGHGKILILFMTKVVDIII